MPGLYLHIPFCRRKCPYCDFFSVADHGPRYRDYPALLQQHLTWISGQGWQGPLDTVYFGGGTPSLLSPSVVGRLLDSIASNFGLVGGAEVTLEANPGTVTASSLAGYRVAGVNRLSLGLQSLDPQQLATLGRLHGRAEGLQAVRWARQAGFANLSLDLMFALPDQTLGGLGAELTGYLDLAPEHLSCYGLSAEPDTPLHRQVQTGELVLPDGDLYAESFLLVHETLAAAGYGHYEIANYARHGHACRHNLGYWQRRQYLGIGAGAHSFRAAGWGERWSVPEDLACYQQALSQGQDPAERIETFDCAGAMRETLYLGLRTSAGVNDEAFCARFGCSVATAFPQAVSRLGSWLSNEDGCWRMSLPGWLLYDRLIQEFL